MKCPHCGSENVYGNGGGKHPRVKCKDCSKTFPLAVAEGKRNLDYDAIGRSNTAPRGGAVQQEKPVSNTEDHQTGNDRELSYTGDQIKTPQQLLDFMQIDMDKWIVRQQWANCQDTGRSRKFKVSLHLQPVTPTQFKWQPIAPISINMPLKRKLIPDKHGKVYKALIVPDSHNGYIRDSRTGELIPMHDRRAWDLVIQIAQLEQPDIIVLQGDMLDLAEWSDRFFRSPNMKFTTQASLIELAFWLRLLRIVCPNARIVYLKGNHEERITRAIGVNTEAAYDLRPVNDIDGPPLVSVDRLLDLASMDIEYVDDYPDGGVWLNDNLRISHGNVVAKGLGKTAEKVLDGARNCEYYGHIHRIEVVGKKRDMRGSQRLYFAGSFGTLGRIDGAIPANQKKNDWQQGCGLIYYNDDLHTPMPLPFYGDRCVHPQGELHAEDRMEQIIEDTGWEPFKIGR